MEPPGARQSLVRASHGGGDPSCAILQQLAIASPEAPEPGAVGTQPVRKAKVRAERPKPVESGSHVDLMAWTRSAHAAHRH